MGHAHEYLFLDFSYTMKMTRVLFDVMCERQILFSTYHRFSSSLHIYFLNYNKTSSSFIIFYCDPPHDFQRIRSRNTEPKAMQFSTHFDFDYCDDHCSCYFLVSMKSMSVLLILRFVSLVYRLD